MTPDEKRAHLEALRRLTAPGGPIDTEAPTATHRQPQNFTVGTRTGRLVLTRSRRRMHDQILAEYFAEKPDVLRDRRAVITSGPPGAGKSSARRERVPKEEEHLWRFVDADEFKKRLVSKMQQSGEYEAMLPPEVRERIAAGESFAPGEFASLVHEESSILAARARRQALDRGERVVFDGVNGSAGKLRAQIDQLAGSGYESVEIITVDGPKPVTRARVEYRWNEAFDQHLAGDVDAGHDARYVPEHITDALYGTDERYSSCARAVAEIVRKGPVEGVTVNATLHYVDQADGAPQLWRTYEQRGTRFSVTRHRRIDDGGTSSGSAGGSPQAGGDDSGGGEVVVPGYTKSDGTVVSSYTRRRRS